MKENYLQLMTTNAVFIFPTLTGHLNRTIRLAKFLQKLGIVVYFAGDYNLRTFTVQHGFEFYLLNTLPFGIGTEYWLHKDKAEGWLESIIDRFTDKQFNLRKEDLAVMMKSLNPSHIFVDVFYYSDFILLHPYLKDGGSKFTFLLTKLPLQKDAGIPPLNTYFQPNERSVKILWQKFFLKRGIKRIGKFIKYLGRDDVSIIHKKFNDVKIPIIHRIFTDKVFQPSFENVDEWILVPQEIDFPNRILLPWQRFVGLMIDVNRNETINKEYKEYIDKIEPHKKIVYCSLGTVLEVHQKKGGVNIKRFFEILLSIFSAKIDYHLIISMEETFKKQLGTIPENVKIFEKVPQVDLLKRCNLFITHGGMNSILESATLGVPMLVFPLNEDWDQNGNAARDSRY